MFPANQYQPSGWPGDRRLRRTSRYGEAVHQERKSRHRESTGAFGQKEVAGDAAAASLQDAEDVVALFSCASKGFETPPPVSQVSYALCVWRTQTATLDFATAEIQAVASLVFLNSSHRILLLTKPQCLGVLRFLDEMQFHYNSHYEPAMGALHDKGVFADNPQREIIHGENWSLATLRGLLMIYLNVVPSGKTGFSKKEDATISPWHPYGLLEDDDDVSL